MSEAVRIKKGNYGGDVRGDISKGNDNGKCIKTLRYYLKKSYFWRGSTSLLRLFLALARTIMRLALILVLFPQVHQLGDMRWRNERI